MTAESNGPPESAPTALEELVQQALQARFAGGRVNVSLDGNRALIEVASVEFQGLSRVRRQQAVYGAIGEFVRDGRLHAVTIRTEDLEGSGLAD